MKTKSPTADVSRLVALCAKSIETLQTSELVDTKVSKSKPVAETKLRAWEKKENASLPADYVAFLVAHGLLELDWRFRTDDGATYDFGGGHQLSVHMPAFNQYRRDPEYPDYNDLAYFATEDQNNHQWAFRLRAGEPVTIVRTDEDGKELAGSFTDWLTEQLTFFGLKSEFPTSARKPGRGQLADLAVVRKRIQLSPPTAAPVHAKKGGATQTLRSLCSSVRFERDTCELTFRKDIPPACTLEGLLPPDLRSLVMTHPPNELDLSSLASLKKLSYLGLTISAPTNAMPTLLLELGRSGQKLRALGWLAVVAPYVDDLSFATVCPVLKSFDLRTTKGALPEDISQICAREFRWRGPMDASVKGAVRMPATLTVSSKLKLLWLSEFAPSPFPSIRGGTNLRELSIDGGRFGTINVGPLGTASPKLVELSLEGCAIEHVQNIGKLAALESLALRDNKLTTYKGLVSSKRLKSVFAAAPMRDFSWIGELPKGCKAYFYALPQRDKDAIVAAYGKKAKLEFTDP